MTEKEKSEFTFNSVEKEDLENTVNLIRKVKHLSLPVEVLKSVLSRPDTIGFVARDKNEKEVGFIIGTLLPTPIITLIATLEQESAKRGLGGMLIDEFVKEIEKRQPKIQNISVDLPTNMTDGVALYSLKGFVVQGFVKGIREGVDMVHLRKDLEKKSRGLFINP